MHQDNLSITEVGENSTTAFFLGSPFDSALSRIRRTIRADHLSIAAEIDAAQRVKRTLDISVPPCHVLLIDNPAFMLETTAVDRASGIFIPLHLVVSATGDHTLVYMLNPEHIRQSDLPIGIKAPVLDLQRQVIRSLTRIAERAHSGQLWAARGECRPSVEVAAPAGEPDAV